LEKRKAITSPTLLTSKDDSMDEVKQIIEGIKVKQMPSVAFEKPSYMSDEDWEEENRYEVEDDKYNEKRVKKELWGCGVPEKYKDTSFNTFIGNDKIKEHCMALAEWEDDIMISGPTGSGKTHLAVSILRNIIERGVIKYPMGRDRTGNKLLFSPGVFGLMGSGEFVTVPRLLMDLRAVFSGSQKKQGMDGWEVKTEQDAIAEYTKPSVLILDDLGAEKTTDYSLTSLYLIIDERINNLKRTIVTTNLTLKEIEEKMDARVASRLSGMKIIKLTMPDHRKKR